MGVNQLLAPSLHRLQAARSEIRAPLWILDTPLLEYSPEGTVRHCTLIKLYRRQFRRLAVSSTINPAR